MTSLVAERSYKPIASARELPDWDQSYGWVYCDKTIFGSSLRYQENRGDRQRHTLSRGRYCSFLADDKGIFVAGNENRITMLESGYSMERPDRVNCIKQTSYGRADCGCYGIYLDEKELVGEKYLHEQGLKGVVWIFAMNGNYYGIVTDADCRKSIRQLDLKKGFVASDIVRASEQAIDEISSADYIPGIGIVDCMDHDNIVLTGDEQRTLVYNGSTRRIVPCRMRNGYGMVYDNNDMIRLDYISDNAEPGLCLRESPGSLPLAVISDKSVHEKLLDASKWND